MVQVHGTCVDIAGTGVLLRGPSGSGKSDLALRLIDGGATLIADDRAQVAAHDGVLVVSAPAEIAGMIEVRGLGIRPVTSGSETALGLVADLVAPETIERMPEPDFWECQGISVPLIRVAPFQASAAAKVRLAVGGVKSGIMPTP